MSNLLLQDSLQIMNQAISETSKNPQSTNWWMWIALVEFGFITFVFAKKRFRKKCSDLKTFKEESIKQEVDFKNIINSSFHSLSLYDELKVKCHPDRFPLDHEKNQIADNLFQEIAKYKTDIKKLQMLKEEAKHKLNINFKN